MTATEILRRLLDERGVEWRKAPHYSGESHDNETIFEGNGIEWYTNDHMNGRLGLRALRYEVTPEQAIEATLGHAYEPPLAAHWDGDTLTLTIPRDPSCIRVQRSAEQPCKVYADESKVIAATLGRGDCRKLPSSGDTVCIVRRHGYEMEFGYWRCSECGCECFEGARYCMGCGRKVRA